MNKLVKCSAAALLAASLFGFGGQFVNAATGYQMLTLIHIMVKVPMLSSTKRAVRLKSLAQLN